MTQTDQFLKEKFLGWNIEFLTERWKEKYTKELKTERQKETYIFQLKGGK